VKPAVQLASAGEEEGERPRRIREEDLEGHFTREDVDPEADEGGAVDGESASDDDLQLARALEVLKSWNYFERLHRGRETQQARADLAGAE